MQNRTGILILTGVLSAICLYFLSFTFVARSIKADAEAYATNKQGQVDRDKKQSYLDSLWKEPVYLGSTLQEVTERELGLGLDLQGGMHVVLEVSPADVLRSLSGNNRDPKFNEALKQSLEDQKTSGSSFVDLFTSNFKKVAPDTKLATIFATSANRSKINYQSTDTEVKKMLTSRSRRCRCPGVSGYSGPRGQIRRGKPELYSGCRVQVGFRLSCPAWKTRNVSVGC